MSGKLLNTLGGSPNDEVYTPEIIWGSVIKALGPIGLDPCGRADATVDAAHYFTLGDAPKTSKATWVAQQDGLELDWGGYGLLFINPPYSVLRYPDKFPWVQKAREEADEAVMFLPASVSSKWWQHTVAKTAPVITCLRGRVKHVGAKHGAAFEQALVYFGPRPDVFVNYFGWTWGWPIVRTA